MRSRSVAAALGALVGLASPATSQTADPVIDVHMHARTRAIREAPFLSEMQKRDILYNNAVRFFRLDPAALAPDGPSDESNLQRGGAA